MLVKLRLPIFMPIKCVSCLNALVWPSALSLRAQTTEIHIAETVHTKIGVK